MSLQQPEVEGAVPLVGVGVHAGLGQVVVQAGVEGVVGSDLGGGRGRRGLQQGAGRTTD